MPPEPFRIVAVRPATKALGVAVMDKTALLFAGVHNLNRRRAQGETVTLRLHRIRTHLLDLIALYQPMVMICEEISPRRLQHTPILGVMMSEIAQVAQEYEIPLKRYSVNTVLSWDCCLIIHWRRSKKIVYSVPFV